MGGLEGHDAEKRQKVETEGAGVELEDKLRAQLEKIERGAETTLLECAKDKVSRSKLGDKELLEQLYMSFLTDDVVEAQQLHHEMHLALASCAGYSDQPWQPEEALWTIEAPIQRPRAFFFCLRTGEAYTATQAADILTDKDLVDNWPAVDAADRAELEAFVKFKVFEAKHSSVVENDNCIDAVWVRRWKWINGPDGKRIRIVKSRLCGRGFLDRQKYSIDRHSSTASRLSQRIQVALKQSLGLSMESWDIGNAFLQGLRFDELREKAKELGLETKKMRKVYLMPPKNVWRHLRSIPGSTIKISSLECAFYVLLLLKPMYGLIDAPLLFQCALLLWTKKTLGGQPSLLDENHIFWNEGGQIAMCWTIHVDDINAIGSQEWLDWSRSKLEKRFGAVKRSKLPFLHNGLMYEELPNGAMLLSQNGHLERIAPMPLDASLSDDTYLGPKGTHDYASVLCSLLYVTICRLELACEVTQLQSFMKNPQVKHAKACNAMLKRAQKELKNFGLHFPTLRWPFRAVSVADAGHASKASSYAHEGALALIMSDVDVELVPKSDVVDYDSIRRLSGPAHAVGSFSRKSRRISHSTSHAETVVAVACLQLTQLIATRITEFYCEPIFHKVADVKMLLDIQDNGLWLIPVDHVTDCFDFYELCTGAKGVPADKSQRLSVLSMREERLSGRLRRLYHCPTQLMLADGLTKPGIFPNLMQFLSTGMWLLQWTPEKPMRMRASKAREFTEQDLVNLDQ